MSNVIAMSLVKTIGIVLYRHTPRGRRYLLLHHRGRYWNFPKGRVEAADGGDELATAWRELREETGIPVAAVRLRPGFRFTYRYDFWASDEGVRQRVVKLAIFFLGELPQHRPIQISDEHLGSAWCDFPTAWRRLCYANSRSVLVAAEAFLDSHRTPAMVKAGSGHN